MTSIVDVLLVLAALAAGGMVIGAATKNDAVSYVGMGCGYALVIGLWFVIRSL